MNRKIYNFSGLFALLFLTGCACYKGTEMMPLCLVEKSGKLTPPGHEALRIEASEFEHCLLKSIPLDAGDGLSDEEAAILAVVLNPTLRAARDQYCEAQAQLLQAGILPNPQLATNLDFVVGGATMGTQTAWAWGTSWDVRSLLTRKPKIESAEAAAIAIHLDVAWLEWQTALAAKAAVNDLISLRDQIEAAEEISNRLKENSDLLNKAEALGEKTLLDAAAAETVANDARTILLGLRQEEARARVALNRAIGYPPDTKVRIQGSGEVRSHCSPPSLEELFEGLEERRLDLIALRKGYDSANAKLRAAILSRFPAIIIGYNRASDTGDVHTAGPGITVDLPIFDRNQGGIALEKATRQRLKDEYTARVFEARSDIAAALEDIRTLNDQIAHAEKALPTLRKVVEVSRVAMEQGNADILAYYAAQRDLTQRSIEKLKLQQQMARACIALKTASATWQFQP